MADYCRRCNALLDDDYCPNCDAVYGNLSSGLEDLDWCEHPVWRALVEDSPATKHDYDVARRKAAKAGVREPVPGLWKKDIESFNNACDNRVLRRAS